MKYVLLFLALISTSACSTKVKEALCIAPFGPVQASEEGPLTARIQTLTLAGSQEYIVFTAEGREALAIPVESCVIIP